MSRSPTASPPSTRSRRPKSQTEQSQFDNATAWLNNSNRTPTTCPIQAVTSHISTDASIGTTALSKYDPVKLTSLYALMRKIERLHLVEDLRLEVSARSERDQTRRQVMEVAGQQIRVGDERTAVWIPLGAACQRALDVTQQLRERLEWCEGEFEAEKLTADAIDEERVWNEGLEIQKREGEEERSLE
jgi:hypothetical protein